MVRVGRPHEGASVVLWPRAENRNLAAVDGRFVVLADERRGAQRRRDEHRVEPVVHEVLLHGAHQRGTRDVGGVVVDILRDGAGGVGR